MIRSANRLAETRLQQTADYKTQRPHLGTPISNVLSALRAHQIAPTTATDIACGGGRLAVALALEFPELSVTGIDWDAGAISFAAALAKKSSVSERCEFRHEDLRRDPTIVVAADLVCLIAAHEVFVSDRALLNTGLAMTAPDGHLLVDGAWLVNGKNRERVNRRTEHLRRLAHRRGGAMLDVEEEWRPFDRVSALADLPSVEETIEAGAGYADQRAARRAHRRLVSQLRTSTGTHSVRLLWLFQKSDRAMALAG